MKSIELNQQQLECVEEIKTIISRCERAMSVQLEGKDLGIMINHFSDIQPLMGTQARLLELSTAVLSHAKGVLIEEYLSLGSEMKVHEFRMWCDGKMAKWDALYQKSDRIIKSFDRYCENCRTIISAEKKLAEV